MASKELKTVEEIKTPATKTTKKAEKKKEPVVNDNEEVKQEPVVNDNEEVKQESKKVPSAVTPPSVNKEAIDDNGMGEYPEEATKNLK